MKYKPDWPEARQRLTALWHHELIDRPCIAVRAPNGKAMPAPALPSDPRDRWINPEWLRQSFLATLENTWWGGEVTPSCLLMAGWIVCLGGTPEFADNTIWFETMNVDMDAPSPFRNKDDDPWVRLHENLYDSVADLAGKDDFLVGTPGMLPANDLLSMLMGTEAFLFNLIDHPQWMREAIITGAREQLRVRQQLGDRIRDRHDFWYGNAGWMRFWAPEPFTHLQSDVSCMLSTEMFEEFVVPELEIMGEGFGALWYHLDGGDARQHLPRLLSLPFMKVIQYTPAPNEPLNGPAHLDLYRTIQAAGRIVHIEVPKDNVLPLLKELDPALLMLDVSCNSVSEGEALLDEAKKTI